MLGGRKNRKEVRRVKILVTGGAGYIGSHTAIILLEQGHQVVIVDNLCNSKKVAVDRIEELSGKQVSFYQYDVCDEEKMREVFEKEKIDAVIHFAGLKAVGESVALPLKYYDNNLTSTLVLLKVMKEFGVGNFVFSSSATVYGDPASVPIREDFPLSTTNPYGTTKLMIERILTDCANADPEFHPVLLRYFNPVGAHESGKLGEDPNGIPNNLVPYITQTVVGKRDKVHVFGNDYPTPDGTGVRDYIHVVDLAKGHAAVLPLFEKGFTGVKVYNLGTGHGYSVLEMIQAFSKAAGKEIPYAIDPRRPGDIPACYADCTKAWEELGWKAEKTLDEMCADSLRWQRMNPNGFED
jgi:UDP-glucose 4-epimerase